MGSVFVQAPTPPSPDPEGQGEVTFTATSTNGVLQAGSKMIQNSPASNPAVLQLRLIENVRIATLLG